MVDKYRHPIKNINEHKEKIINFEIMNSEKVRAAIKEGYGDVTNIKIRNELNSIALGKVTENAEADRLVAFFRKTIQVYHLGYNVVSGVVQLAGLVPAMATVGAYNVTRSTAKGIVGYSKLKNKAMDNSSVMRSRFGTQTVELIEQNKNLINYKSKTASFFSKNAPAHVYNNIKRGLDASKLALISIMQEKVDVIVWNASFDKATNAGFSNEDAINIANNDVITTQGSGLQYSLSPSEKTAKSRALNMFYTFDNMILNLMYIIYNDTDFMNKNYSSSERAKRALVFAHKFILIYVIPAILADALRGALMGKTKEDDEDDEDKSLMAKIGGGVVDYALVPVLRGLPYLRDATVIASPYKYNGGLITEPIKILKDASVAFQKDDELSYREWELAFNMVGVTTGFPPKALTRSVIGAKKRIDGESSIENLMQGIMSGR